MGDRAGLWQRGVRSSVPTRSIATILYAFLAVLAMAVLGAGLLYQSDSWPLDWPRPPFQVSGGVILAVSALTLLLLAATVLNGRRWHTARSIVRLSKDPALASALPPGQVLPRGPFVAAPPPLRVHVVRPPRFRQRPRPLHRVTATRNVLGGPPLNIVYLRVFENESRARTFARGAWREFGHVYLLRSAASISPKQFKDAKRADALGSLLINSTSMLTATLAEAPTEPDPPGWRMLDTIAGSTVLVFDRYGAYPTRSLICHASFWQTALDELLRRADLVVLDLSGYLTRNQGTQYELQRVVDTFPLSRVILLADPWSNTRFLERQVHDAWDHMAVGSPNALTGPQAVPLALTDYYVQHQTQYAGSSVPVTTRTELRASRAQTRWLLAHAERSPREKLLPPPSGTTGEEWPPPPPPPLPAGNRLPPRPLPVKLLGAPAAVIVAIVVMLWAVLGESTGFGGTGALAVGDYYIRTGPSKSSPDIGSVRRGQEVQVDCLTQGWARLDDPSPGGYVYSGGLEFEDTPPPCS